MFHEDVLEGAWSIDRRTGLDDLLPEAPGPWTRIYFEKGRFGFVRVGNERVRFESKVDPAESTLRLSKLGGRASSTLEGTFAMNGREGVHFEGSREGIPFAMDLTREFPR